MFPQTFWLSVCRERTGGYQKFPFCIQQAWRRDFMKPSIEYMHNFISPCTRGILPLDTMAASPLSLYGKHYSLFLTHIPIKVIRGMFLCRCIFLPWEACFDFFLYISFQGNGGIYEHGHKCRARSCCTVRWGKQILTVKGRVLGKPQKSHMSLCCLSPLPGCKCWPGHVRFLPVT